MADVYGFNEAKSKVQVVDKATQDATDSSQNSRLSAVESKNTEQDNRLTALEENAGGAVDVEKYGTVPDTEHVSFPVTFASSTTITKTYSSSLTTKSLALSEKTSSDALYYDTNSNTLKRCKEVGYNNGQGTTSMATNYWVEIRNTTVENAVLSALSGLKFNSNEVTLIMGTKCVMTFKLTLSNYAVTSLYMYQCKMPSTSVTLSGTVTATIAYGTAIPIKSISSMPSTYKQVMALT